MPIFRTLTHNQFGTLFRRVSIFIVFFALTFLFFLTFPQNALAGYEIPEPDSIAQPRSAGTIDYIRLYQRYISHARGHECPMYPSCSHYGLQAFSSMSFVPAFVWTSDRLLRCGHEHEYYPLTLTEQGFKLLDKPGEDVFPDELIYQRNRYFFPYSDLRWDDSTTMFIKRLMNSSQFELALLELSRKEFYGGLNLELYTNKIIALRALGDYENAIFDFESRSPPEFRNYPDLVYHISAIEYSLGNYEMTLERNRAVLEGMDEPDPYIAPRFFQLNGLAHARLGQWDEAVSSYESMLIFPQYERTGKINLELLNNSLPLRRKSPVVAGLLSVIPGAGYAYTGHTQTAISSFLINGLLGYATYTSIKNENYGMAILTGIFNLSFYIGNIGGASRSAHRFNDHQKRSLINSLEFNSDF